MAASPARRIPCSHVGTLPRPDDLEAVCPHFGLPADDEAFTAIVPVKVTEVVRRQAELGLAIVNDGEYGKRGGFSYYAQTRLSGIERRAAERAQAARNIVGRDALEFPGYYEARRRRPAAPVPVRAP